jgi:hypothetical protein
MTMSLRSMTLALVLSAASAAAPAQLAERSVTLDANTIASRAYQRELSAAIEEVCGSYAAVDYAQWDEIDRCRAGARASVDRQLAKLRQSQPVRLGSRR